MGFWSGLGDGGLGSGGLKCGFTTGFWRGESGLETGRKWRRKILLSSMESRGKWVVVWRLFWWCFAGKRRK
ncbi:hypothetical protein KY284_023503 [Solanum tuberosum]|nr:hypothetical protein KY284_023503 [Solanum tuberosum]